MTGTLDSTKPSVEDERAEPARRGKLRIDRSVLRKIAEHAANLEPDCVPVARRVAGIGTGKHGATAHVTGPDRQLHVHLDLALRYPAPVASTVRAVRERVGGELERLAGCRAASVDVRVTALVPQASAPRVE
ncbi:MULTISPECIES: Asp23/Gls24 family envelope stress response protein [unclassified Actinopolyspora]|uniref:Asp23/Gls24 family envelope stress response protein n=1 Tax=unclassified Actinopolyspora TaxID=2639451 RepID=UPI0013F69B66|nr:MULTISPECIES: Asp23/Gls24 family envelope stress response protein [unclassified Actinopolyspora]NHD17447.1 Asp23/Gls24 family envelope stress response protein [Actinopolyspora sp. BKK2]NHE76820.1 Asp23/Gls24 family envelope stress response protein [Actinopolyspora sp. BKK1]